MDWLKLFALLVAVASVRVTAEGPKKKIRIHLPQKVKHIHHHKKIYITNHPAPSQYAPAFSPGVKGAVALPSNVARPAVANIVPFNSVEVYEDSRTRLPAVSPTASKLLPLYRARGHYGPNNSEWDDQEYDLAPPPEPTDIYSPPTYPAPSASAPASPSLHSKRVKIVKVNEPPRKKVIRKVKPKRVYVRPVKPQPAPQQAPPEDEHPVSSFHEQFYSDLEETGTIRKIRKPPRIEKIIDGDTEHIHTYSEEHIHKVVFEDDPKLTGIIGVDNIGSMSALTAAHPLIPLKNAQTLVAIPPDTISDYSVVGSMGTPSHLEYASYNPRDVTHDHIYHDHGEIPSNVDLTKDALKYPPKVSYNSQGLPINQGDPSKRYKGKLPRNKSTSPTPDFSYYENIYSYKYDPKKFQSFPPSLYRSSNPSIDKYSPISSYNFKDHRKPKTQNSISQYGGKQVIPNFQLQQASVPAPFSVSTTVVHDYQPKNYPSVGPSPAGFSKYRDPLVDFKNSYSSEFDYDTSASSNLYTTDDKNDSTMSLQGKPGKKSISTQNINFGGQDHQTIVDHLASSSNAELSLSDESPTAMEQGSEFDEADMTVETTPYTIKETSPAHPYYTAMALQAFHGDQPEASNDNAQYVEVPTQMTPIPPSEISYATTTSHPQFYKIQSTDAISPEINVNSEIRSHTHHKRRRERQRANRAEHKQRLNGILKDLLSSAGDKETSGRAMQQSNNKFTIVQSTDSSNVRGNLKYGDKI